MNSCEVFNHSWSAVLYCLCGLLNLVISCTVLRRVEDAYSAEKNVYFDKIVLAGPWL